MLERAKKSLAGGVSSEFRKFNYPHALFYTSAAGSRIKDVDGNEYLDFSLSQGPMILGHSHPHVLQRVRDYSAVGQLFAGQHKLELELAEKLQGLIPSAELMRFCLDGSEAVQTALRVARARTGRPKFLRFEGHYHGWLDNMAWGNTADSLESLDGRENPTVTAWGKGIAASSREDFIILPWNDLELLEKVLDQRHAEIAAIITEPIMCNNGCIMPKPGFLQGLRSLCDQYAITLIFDEVITGFRVAFGGAQEYFGIIPDLAVFAKALASGYPISVITGKREWMDLLANGTVIQAGTMNASNPTVAAALATLEILEKDQPYPRLFELGRLLMNGIKDLAKKHGQQLSVTGPGPMFHTAFTNNGAATDYRDVLGQDKKKLAAFIAGLHDNGIRVIGRGLWYISTAHTREDIQCALCAVHEVLSEFGKSE